MYTEQELNDLNRQIKRRWLMMLLPLLLMLALIVTALIIRSELMADLATLLLGGLMIFSYETAIKPLLCYRRLLNGLLHGRNHELDCEYSRIDDEISLVEGVNYWAVTVICDDEKTPYERLFYLDAQKPRLQLAAGTPVHLVYHDRMLREIVPC